MEQLNFDTIILGGGPAGLSAAIYASRGAVSTAIVDINMLGGQPSNYLELENYPGFQIVGGYDLMEKFEEHADKFGVHKFPMQEVKSIDLKSKTIITNEYEFKAKTIIIATGAQPMKLGVPGENEFLGRGVSYCAVCDGAFYRNKVVAVIGGGNAAVLFSSGPFRPCADHHYGGGRHPCGHQYPEQLLQRQLQAGLDAAGGSGTGGGADPVCSLGRQYQEQTAESAAGKGSGQPGCGKAPERG